MARKKSTRDIMHDSNGKALDYLLHELNCQQVWLKPHYRYSTTTYCRDYSYKTQDIYNLWDGLCSWKRQIYAIQIKTDAWDSAKRHIEFQQGWARNIPILFINVHKDGMIEHKEILPEGINKGRK